MSSSQSNPSPPGGETFATDVLPADVGAYRISVASSGCSPVERIVLDAAPA
ncbi:MAG: hypothetical protein ACR2HR_00650 [Euzebya sp.]